MHACGMHAREAQINHKRPVQGGSVSVAKARVENLCHGWAENAVH